MVAVAKEKDLRDWRVQEDIFVAITHTCLSERVTFEQRPEGRERVGYVSGPKPFQAE